MAKYKNVKPEQRQESCAKNNRTTVKVKALKVPEGKVQHMEVNKHYWVSEDSAIQFKKSKLAKIDDPV